MRQGYSFLSARESRRPRADGSWSRVLATVQVEPPGKRSDVASASRQKDPHGGPFYSGWLPSGDQCQRAKPSGRKTWRMS